MAQCVATKRRSGEQCKRSAIKGGTVCPSHGGSAPQVRAKAAVRAELAAWGLGDPNVDPGETLLQLIAQSKTRAELYALELEELVAESPTLRAALVAPSFGEFGPTGEYVRGLAVLEAQERDRCANFSVKGIAAGLAERQVKLAEQQAELVLKAIDAALDAAGVTGATRGTAKLAAARHLKAV